MQKVSVALVDENSSVESANDQQAAISVKFNELMQQNQQHKLEIVSGMAAQKSGYDLTPDSQRQQTSEIKAASKMIGNDDKISPSNRLEHKNQQQTVMIPKTMPRTPHLDLMSPEKEPRK